MRPRVTHVACGNQKDCFEVHNTRGKDQLIYSSVRHLSRWIWVHVKHKEAQIQQISPPLMSMLGIPKLKPWDRANIYLRQVIVGQIEHESRRITAQGTKLFPFQTADHPVMLLLHIFSTLLLVAAT